MNIRLATPVDAEALAYCWYAMLGESGLLLPQVDPGWHPIVAPHIASNIREGTALWFVAEEAGSVVATAAAFFIETAASLVLVGRQATIAGVYTDPAFRRRGYARALTERVIEACQGRGCSTVRLRASRAGRPLYESLGFVDGNEMVLDVTHLNNV